VNGARTDFLYDGVNPVQELSGTSVTANMLSGLGVDEYFTRTDARGTHTLLTDALGSTLALTDNAGTVPSTYTYEPYGRTTTTGTTNPNPFQYTGRENDGTGLYYYRARYYDPKLGRFLQEEPTRLDGPNLYLYTADNPLIFVDPDGRWLQALIVAGWLNGAIVAGRLSGAIAAHAGNILAKSVNMYDWAQDLLSTDNNCSLATDLVVGAAVGAVVTAHFGPLAGAIAGYFAGNKAGDFAGALGQEIGLCGSGPTTGPEFPPSPQYDPNFCSPHTLRFDPSGISNPNQSIEEKLKEMDQYSPRGPSIQPLRR
jgi:RHS repeat-associated protein